MARLASEDYDTIRNACWILSHPRYRQNVAVARMRIQRADDNEVFNAISDASTTLSYYGRFQESLDLLEDPRIDPVVRAGLLYDIRTFGFPVPVESLEEAFGSIAIDSTTSPYAIVRVGLYAADRARWSDHQRVIAALERRANLARAQGDSLSAWSLNRRGDFVRGYGLWKRRGPEAALPFLGDPNQRAADWLSWWWLGQLYQELGRLREAERVYQTFRYPSQGPISIDPLAHRELGKVYEALGEYEKARKAYEYFVEYWRDADPEVQPMVEEARQAIVRLKGLQRE